MGASCAPQPGHTQLRGTAENSLCLLFESGNAATSVPQQSLNSHSPRVLSEVDNKAC